MERKSTASRIALKVARLDPRRYEPRVLYCKSMGLPPSNVEAFALKSGAAVTINGGFFDEKRRPLGILIIGGKTVRSPYKPTFDTSGVFWWNGKAAGITLGKEFSSSGIVEALSCSPRLIARGTFTEGVKGLDRIARRTGIAIDNQGRIYVFVTEPLLEGLSFRELRAVLKAAIPGCTDALCLDGGGSTQMSIRAGGFEDKVAGLDPVPVALGFVPVRKK
jgi:uncharacterized protein YigE (DUF2233 family)